MFAHRLLIDDPDGFLGARRTAVRRGAKAALAQWAAHIDGRGCLVIKILVAPTASGRFEGASLRNVRIGSYRRAPLWEDGGPHKLRTGKALGPVDGIIRIAPDSSYLADEIFLADDTVKRSTPIPAGKLDGVSVFMHEIGHIIGINGHLDRASKPPGRRITGYSTYDRHVRIKGNRVMFSGPATIRAFGAPLPLTTTDREAHRGGNLYHYGNPGERDAQLGEGLMTGWPLKTGRRYDIGPLERAILRDIGLALAPAAPVKSADHP
jgi:hypothetical protein